MIKSAGQKNKSKSKRAALIAFKFAVLFAALLIFSSPNQISAQTSTIGSTAAQVLGATPLGVGLKLGTAAASAIVSGGNPVDAASATVGPSVIGTILSKVISWIAFVVNYIVSYIFGAAISVILYFITVIVSLNFGLAQSPLVQSGFPITLSIANLGFVLAIIVIAIMTIIRWEAYALKNTLLKLVAAAILVNFSLVIASAILGFADGLTLAFLAGMNPAGGAGGVLGNLHTFALNMANSFGPQSVFLSAQISTTSSTVAAQVEAAQGAGSSFAKILVSISNLFFPTIFLIVSVIALGGILIMFLIRYIYLGILLILMPFAWLFWIFPVTSEHWHKWWSKFIQWTMFAPVVMFFLYLAMATTNGLKNAMVGRGDTEIVRSLAAVGFFSQSFGPMLQMATMVALVFAGLFTAQKMGIMFADSTLKGMTAVTSGFGRWAGRKGLQYGGAPFRTKFGEERKSLADRAQEFARTRKTAVGRYVAGWGARGVSRAATLGGEDLVSEYGKDAAKMATPDLLASISTSFGPKKVARMMEAGKRGVLEGLNMDDTHKKETRELFGNFGKSKDYEKYIEKKSGVSSEMYEAAKRGAPQEEIDALAATLASKFSRAEVGDMQASDLHSKQAKNFGLDAATISKLATANAYGFAAAAPQFSSTILSKLKGKSLDNFTEDYRNSLVSAEGRGVISTAEYTKRNDAFKQSILNNVMGFVPMAEAAAPAGGTPPPTPPPKTP